MTDNSVTDLLSKLKQIQNDISEEIENIFGILSFFLASTEVQQYFLKNLDNIQRIHDSAFLLKKELANLFDVELTHQKLQTINLPEYLGKIRHDLRNPVNAIQGYAEITLEDLRANHLSNLATKLIAIIKISRKITHLIDKIRVEHITLTDLSLEIPLKKESKISTEELHSAEYKEYKEKFVILIADDIEENRNVLKQYLHHIGYKNIFTANNGRQALAMLKNNKFDLILLDIDMPEMNGIELLKRLKQELIQRRFMIIMITGSDTVENAIQCIQLGAEDILPKPFHTDLLRVRINSCIEKKWFITKENIYRKEIETERQRYRTLLHSVFPPTIVKELVETNQVQARQYHNVAVLFTDVVGFTNYCDTHSMNDIMKNIQELADVCEIVTTKYKLQKVKTIGDGFLAIAGMLTKHKNPVFDCLLCANEILKQSINLPAKWQLHAGIDYGAVTGGIIGHRQYLFDIWSDTVNTSARIQALAKPGMIYLSKAAWLQVKDICQGESLGMHSVKGKQESIELFVVKNFSPPKSKD